MEPPGFPCSFQQRKSELLSLVRHQHLWFLKATELIFLGHSIHLPRNRKNTKQGEIKWKIKSISLLLFPNAVHNTFHPRNFRFYYYVRIVFYIVFCLKKEENEEYSANNTEKSPKTE